jgi:ABC-2 type transport system ATP-binding protein
VWGPVSVLGGSRGSGGEAVVLQGLEKSWRGPAGPVHAVRGIDVRVARGETVALLGPNGAGKSTTIDMILGLARPDGGSVSVLGGSPADAVAEGRVGAMLQTGALIRNLSVRELVSMAASLYPRPLAVERVLELVGLQGVANQRTQKLSGGETQRVRFAVALVGDPELLILDEPTVAMDVEARRAFWSSMRRLAAEGRTLLFATHYLDEAYANADRAVLLARGTVVADGPTTEIKGRVGTRTIRATLPGAEPEELTALEGVKTADRHGDAITLVCTDSDRAIRALLARHEDVRDIEITGAGLEDAFVRLVGEEALEGDGDGIAG